MISKELLSEVLSSLTLLEIIDGKIDNNVYFKVEEIDILQSVNIYELAHKCKEWAINLDRVGVFSVCRTQLDGYIEIQIDIKMDKEWKTIQEKTEPEAIFKACQWILDNKAK